MCDLIWSDPEATIKVLSIGPRAAGYFFGGDIVESFCELNKVDFNARAYQLVMQGYKFMFGEKLATIWSVPNYCYKCGNSTVIFQLDENLIKS
jgi:serine/threonine-protein phosphatase 4 catalytic subunit